MEQDFDSRVADLQNRFSQTDNKIAQALLQNRRAAIDVTVSQMAKLCHTSEASIIRFAKKLGYSGYYQLKVAFATSLFKEDKGVDDVATAQQSPLNRTFTYVTDDLKRTMNSIDKESLKKVADLLLQAGVINIFAVGNTVPIALDFSYKLASLGLSAYFSQPPEIMIAHSKCLKKEDLAFAISHSGESKSVLSACTYAKESGAKIALLTNFSDSPLTAIADFIIKTNTHHLNKGKFVISYSRICEMFVIELLFKLLEEELGDRSANLLTIQSENRLSDFKV